MRSFATKQATIFFSINFYFVSLPDWEMLKLRVSVSLLCGTCGEGWMPDQGESVVEHVGGVQPRFAGVNYGGPIIGLCKLDFHKLGDVERK